MTKLFRTPKEFKSLRQGSLIHLDFDEGAEIPKETRIADESSTAYFSARLIAPPVYAGGRHIATYEITTR